VAIKADGNAVQTREHGGWVKAMAYVDPASGIVRCYNSMSSLHTVGGCGITYNHFDIGIHDVDFGFNVNDRFILLTSASPNSIVISIYGGGPTAVRVLTEYNYNASRTDSPFFIFVF